VGHEAGSSWDKLVVRAKELSVPRATDRGQTGPSNVVEKAGYSF